MTTQHLFETAEDKSFDSPINPAAPVQSYMRGLSRGSSELIAAYRVSPWLRQVVSKIAFRVASVRWRLYSVKGDAKSLSSRGRLTTKDIGTEVGGDAQELTKHPLLDLLTQPNAWMSGLEMRKLTQTYLDLKGEAFLMVSKNFMNAPVQAWPIPPQWILSTPDLGLDDDQHYVMASQSMRQDVDVDDIIWLRDPDPSNPYGRGTGVGESLGDEIESDEYASKFLKGFFRNRARPDVIVTMEGAGLPELKAAKAQWEAETLGIDRGSKTSFTGRKVDVKEMQQTLGDMGVLDIRRWQRDTIMSVYGVPPEILGIVENSNRATITASQAIFANEVLTPRLEFLRNALQSRLVPLYDDRLVLAYESPNPTDIDIQLDALKTAPWCATVGEWRVRAGLPSRGEQDDVHLVPSGYIPVPSSDLADLDEIAAALAPTPAPAQALRPVPTTPPKAAADVTGKFAHVVSKAPNAVIDLALEALRPQSMRKRLDPLWRRNVESWGKQQLEDINAEPKFDMLNPLVEDHLDEFAGDRIDMINAYTQSRLRNELAEGFSLGEGIDDLAKRVESSMDLQVKWRAKLIARTEVMRSSNFGTYAAHSMSGIVQNRRWVATNDDRTRDEHAELGGLKGGPAQVVGINEPFEIDGMTAMYPGDFAEPGMSIQCRCTTVAVIDAPVTMMSNSEIWKRFDSRAKVWEKEARIAIREAFREQTADVTAALRKAMDA